MSAPHDLTVPTPMNIKSSTTTIAGYLLRPDIRVLAEEALSDLPLGFYILLRVGLVDVAFCTVDAAGSDEFLVFFL